MSTIETINTQIDQVHAAEKITKKVLAELSRNILSYVYVEETGDVQPVNRLIRGLTPASKKAAILFFKNFLAWGFDESECQFTKKKKKLYDDKAMASMLFLEDENNTIWTWFDANVEMKAKPKDYVALLTKYTKEAIEKGGLSVDDIMTIIENSIPEELEEAA